MKTNNKLVEDIEKFCKNIDIDYQLEFVKRYEKIGDSVLYGGKHCGSDAEHAGSKYIAEQLKTIGLSNIELIPCQTCRFQFNDATLKIKGDSYEIKPYGYVSPGTGSEGLCAEIVNVNRSTKEDYENININGKIALFKAMGTLEGGNLSGQIEEAAIRGAVALVIYAVEDVLDEETIRVQPPNIISRIPIVGICCKDADYIKDKLTEANCTAELVHDAEFKPNQGTTYNVVGEIPGRYSDEKIIFTAHLDHYFRCLQDNISTCSTIIGIAKAIIDAGITPNRTLVFAFHGSHEAGGQDTRYPYIYGSYKLANEDKPEWGRQAIANINFEYTALKQKVFQMFGYPGVYDQINEYFNYSPKLVGGFDKKNSITPESEYYMLSWSDSISYLNAGIPTYCNDPISEQLYEGKGPYVGRDHSNKDNWDIFDRKALEDTGRQFGGLGLYLDSLPYMHINHSETVRRIKKEIDKDALEEMEVSTKTYFDAVDEFDIIAKEVQEYVDAKNNEYVEKRNAGLSNEDIIQTFDAAAIVNSEVKESFIILAKEIDKINSYDFLQLATAKYLTNIQCMITAMEKIKLGEVDEAFEECIMALDLAPASHFFSREVAEHMRNQICAPEFADRRTWARGRELEVYTHYNLVQDFKEEMVANVGYEKTLQNLEVAIECEKANIASAMNNERLVIGKITDILKGVVK